MAFKALRDFIDHLESSGELIRITYPVNTELEITEIVDRVSKSEGGGKALLFENTGTDFPVLINAFGSEKRMTMSLGYENLEIIISKIEHLFNTISKPKSTILDKLKFLPELSRVASWMPKSIKGKGICQEIRMETPDLAKLPILKCWPADGGSFITLPCVITRDPETGIRNVGMYRMQVLSKDTTGMHWHKHKTGAKHFAAYRDRGMKMPVSVVLGGDPAYTYAATAPLPDNIDEYMLAGFLRNKKVELVKCLTSDLEVPADADFVIEGYVDPAEELIWEGPFGDHTGFYSLADWYPKFHVTCITHRKNAVYPATIVGIPPQEDAYIGKATERIFLAPMKFTLIPELKDIDLPYSGVAHNITIAKINKTYPGQAQKVMNAMWGAGQMMFNKILIVTDQDTSINKYQDLALKIFRMVNPAQDIYFSRGPVDVLDHSSSKFAYGSKMGIDATFKYDEEILKTDPPIDYSVSIPDLERKIKLITGIEKVNSNLLSKGFSILILGINKGIKSHLDKIIGDLLSHSEVHPIKFIILVDHELNIDLPEVVSWYASGNIDPMRDCRIVEPKHDGEAAHLIINGTKKDAKNDGFARDWPNPVVSSLETIEKIDRIWPELGIGDFIPSPSLNYRMLRRGEGAVAAE